MSAEETALAVMKNSATPDNIRIVLEAIRVSTEDSEVCHCLQDKMLFWVLAEIALGCADGHDPKALAQEALKVKTIEFSRWYA